MTVSSYFTDDHRSCDQTWAEVERLVDEGQEAPAQAAFARFAAEMEHHFAMEEQVLFPAFEQATGMTAGPTQVMRMEHDQMRVVLGQIIDHAERGDFDGMLDHGDTLHMLIQQHNAKEEGILYPMAERLLAGGWNDVAGRLVHY